MALSALDYAKALKAQTADAIEKADVSAEDYAAFAEWLQKPENREALKAALIRTFERLNHPRWGR